MLGLALSSFYADNYFNVGYICSMEKTREKRGFR